MNVSTFNENGITIHSASVEDVRAHFASNATITKRATALNAGDRWQFTGTTYVVEVVEVSFDNRDPEFPLVEIRVRSRLNDYYILHELPTAIVSVVA